MDYRPLGGSYLKIPRLYLDNLILGELTDHPEAMRQRGSCNR
jgi:hypothetical protein